MAHFSKYIRPGAIRIGFENPDPALMVTAAQNPDGTIAVVVLNMEAQPKNLKLQIGDRQAELQISAQALQTIVIAP
jgi:glucosylceramidase